MQVVKFGGTSLGHAARMNHVADIVTKDTAKKFIVLSAISGTTNKLYEICDARSQNNKNLVIGLIDDLKSQYLDYIMELFPNEHHRSHEMLKEWVIELSALSIKKYTKQLVNEIVVMGEMFSTQLFTLLLKSRGISTKLVNAAKLIILNKDGEPEVGTIALKAKPLLKEDVDIWVTQGFICTNSNGEIDNLKRGGSDYTASLLGAAIGAEEIQIWTDIDGMHNNDPRVVKKTKPIAKLSFNEAAELAYFGAKILHPASVQPAKRYEINVKIKNTMDPDAEGTLITRVKRPKEAMVKAIAAKDNIIAIKVRSSRMLMAYGFLKKIFEVFENFKTPIDMVTTSEVAVSLTIDDKSNLYKIISELETLGEVEVDYDQSIICIVGNLVSEDKGLVSKIFNSMSNVPIRMISYGGSRYNISMLVASKHKSMALNNLNKGLFDLD